MAVTIRSEAVVAGIYAQPSIETNARVGVILEAAIPMVEDYAPNAPSAIQNQAVVRLVGIHARRPAGPGISLPFEPNGFQWRGQPCSVPTGSGARGPSDDEVALGRGSETRSTFVLDSDQLVHLLQSRRHRVPLRTSGARPPWKPLAGRLSALSPPPAHRVPAHVLDACTPSPGWLSGRRDLVRSGQSLSVIEAVDPPPVESV